MSPAFSMHVDGVSILISTACQLLSAACFGGNPEETREYLDLTTVLRWQHDKIRGTKVCRMEKSDSIYELDTITCRECRSPH